VFVFIPSLASRGWAMSTHSTSDLDRFGRAKQVCRLLGISRSTLYVWLKDPTKGFPRPLELGPGTKLWWLPDVIAWARSHGRGPSR
jgi:predicted DNA-binding transcriptional regulator AlpA